MTKITDEAQKCLDDMEKLLKDNRYPGIVMVVNNGVFSYKFVNMGAGQAIDLVNY